MRPRVRLLREWPWYVTSRAPATKGHPHDDHFAVWAPCAQYVDHGVDRGLRWRAGPANAGQPTPTVTANAFILPAAVSLGDSAFGDEPVVVHQGERLRWVNADTLAHVIVADSPDATDFRKTDELPPGGEQSFIMTKPGTTRIHCETHPNMTGTLVVRDH
jgi:plastocyanin